MKQYLLKLTASLVLGYALLKAPFVAPYVDMLCVLLAKLTFALISPFDPKVAIDGAIYYRSSYAYAIEVTKECSGMTYVLLLATAIMMLPLQLGTRVRAALISVIYVQVINVVRLITLLYGRVLLPQVEFDIFHLQFLGLFLAAGSLLFFVLFLLKHFPPSTAASSLRVEEAA